MVLISLKCRKDSFITHRAFCDALAEESSKPEPSTVPPSADEGPKTAAVFPPQPSPPPSSPQAPVPEDSSPTEAGSSISPDKNPGSLLKLGSCSFLSVFFLPKQKKHLSFS